MGIYTSADMVRENYRKFISTSLISDDKINYFIARVEGLVNGILFKVYALPLSCSICPTPTAPELIVTIATDMVTARCLKYFYDSNQAEENPVAKNMWKENLDMLKSMVAKTPELLLPCTFRDGVTLNEKGQLEFGSTTNAPSEIWSSSFDPAGVPYSQIFRLDSWVNSGVSDSQEYDINYDRLNK
jgi:hypothetical protein